MNEIYNIGNGNFNNISIDFSTNKEIIKNNNITNELEELYNKNKTRINNYSFVKKIIKLFSKGE